MTERYVKCKIWTNMPVNLFSDEVLVSFRTLSPENIRLRYKGIDFPPNGEDWRILSNRDIRLHNGEYVIRVAYFESERKKRLALIGIKDCSENRVYHYTVFLDDIVMI